MDLIGYKTRTLTLVIKLNLHNFVCTSYSRFCDGDLLEKYFKILTFGSSSTSMLLLIVSFRAISLANAYSQEQKALTFPPTCVHSSPSEAQQVLRPSLVARSEACSVRRSHSRRWLDLLAESFLLWTDWIINAKKSYLNISEHVFWSANYFTR
jgi:hypothetical protein